VHPRAHESTLPANLRMIPEHVQVIRAQAWDAARHFSILGRYPSALALPDRWSSWIPFGVRAALRAHRVRPFDAIFSTFPISSAQVIGARLQERLHVPWVADFRDPMATQTYPHDPALRVRWRRIQDVTFERASCVTVTAPGAAEFYRRMYPSLDAGRLAVIENGFDPGLLTEPAAAGSAAVPGRAVFLHSGILYPRERNPEPFFRALRTLLDRGLISRDSVCVRLRASGFDDRFAALAASLGVSDLIELAPALPYEEALREMSEASALLLFQARVCNDQIPAKAYEYLAAGRPILGLADPAGDTGRLLQRFGVPDVTALEDESALVTMLERALPAIRAGTYPVAERSAVMAVSRRAGAEQLAAILDRVVAARR
jgi:glycosyltransferase involved in cell wall biosynthesis